ncbi:hypothetical protein [Ornithinibacillus californiensis]|uniref:hypothetical protein n=1 Tax=Ornithinibacillus californiensis TaxID=161536 RepID=UPI00064DD9AA|nr:hypothetical protein [Ornithinibacillus californiensis]
MHFIPCKNDEEIGMMVDFILNHRQEINANYDAKTTFFSIGTQLLYGEVAIAVSSQEQVVGTVGYISGTPEYQFQDTHRARIEMVYIDENYRCTNLFIKGIMWVIDLLKGTNKDVTHIEFYVPKENRKLQQLSSKFAQMDTESKSNFGVEVRYIASIQKVQLYFDKLQKNRKRVSKDGTTNNNLSGR